MKPNVLSRLLLTALALTATLQASAQVTDRLIFQDAKVNPEFSVDGRHLAWTLRTTQGDQTAFTVWYDRIDPISGLPVSQGAYGTQVGDGTATTLPQWGQAAPSGAPNCPLFDGNYAVFTTPDFYFAKIYGTTSGPPCVEVLGPDRDSAPPAARRLRAHPFPMKNIGVPNQWVSFTIDDTQSHLIRVFVVDLSQQDVRPIQVHEEPQTTPWGTLSGTFYSRPWWRLGGTLLYFGMYDSLCENECPVQIGYVDTAALGTPEILVTSDGLSKVSMYPYMLDGVARFSAGSDFTATGLLYREASSGNFIIENIVPYESWQSGLVSSDDSFDPFLHQSFETFVWGGETYASYTISEQNNDGKQAAVTQQTEVWIAKLSGLDVFNCRVSAIDELGQPMSRTEPEPVIAGSRAYLYYSSGPIAIDDLSYAYQLRRISIPSKSAFDAACAAGNVITQ